MSILNNTKLEVVAAAMQAEKRAARKSNKRAQIDVWYYGNVKSAYASTTGATHDLGVGGLPVRAVSAEDFELAVIVDGYELSWVVEPVGSHSFMIVPAGTVVADATVIDPNAPEPMLVDGATVAWLDAARALIAAEQPVKPVKTPKEPKPVKPAAEQTLADKVKAELKLRRKALADAQAALDALLAVDEPDMAAVKAARDVRNAAQKAADADAVKAEIEASEQPAPAEPAYEAPTMPAPTFVIEPSKPVNILEALPRDEMPGTPEHTAKKSKGRSKKIAA